MLPISVIEFTGNDIKDFKQQLTAKIAVSPTLFYHLPVILALDTLSDCSESCVQQLLFVLRTHNILPIALRGTEQVKPLAEKLDLAWIPPCRKKLQQTPSTQEISDKIDSSQQGMEEQVIEEQIITTPPPLSAHAHQADVHTLPPIVTTKIITTPVRSGQQVYAKDSDLIVLTQVGQGAEIIADGNIHIYGTLRGRAIAGASGNKEARIFCQSLKAELISIAGTYKVSDDLPAAQTGASCQIELKENNLHITSL